MFLKLKHFTGPIIINTAHVMAMSPATDEEGNLLAGQTDLDMRDGKNLTVDNDLEAIWEKMKGVNGTSQASNRGRGPGGRSLENTQASGEADPGV